jgi:sulfur relay (sulfurtransferase) DsrC/TusE family protein
MKPSSELFDLIRTLTKSEKRFFKLQSSLQSGDKNYVRLFDLIEKMEAYDEDLVKKTFKGEKFIKHLPSEKNHLYKLILKSLRSYYSETSIASSLKQEIKNVEILYNKGLFDECTKFIERAKKTAIRMGGIDAGMTPDLLKHHLINREPTRSTARMAQLCKPAMET